MRTFPRSFAVLALVVTTTLTGCGGSDGSSGGDQKPSSKETSAAAPDVEAADGSTIKGDGYSYTVPEGWETPPNGIPGFDPDSLAIDSTDDDGFADNINVLKQAGAPSSSISKSKDEITKQLKSAGLADLEVKEITSIDGEEALHASSSQNLNGKKNKTEQYYAFHDGDTYIVTLSFSTTVSDDDREETAQSILTTWAWAS